MVANRIEIGGLQVAKVLDDLVRNAIAPGTGVDADHFWRALGDIVRDLGPRNRALLQRRDELQAQIDQWYLSGAGQRANAAERKAFLLEIGYLLPEGDDFSVSTSNVDPEIAEIAGPQLVVPVDNARYALNAANARWGSLYDALYGTDVIPETEGRARSGGYNPARGAAVIAQSQQYLDQYVPLATGSYADVTSYGLSESGGRQNLVVTLQNGSTTGLAEPAQFVGYNQANGRLNAILLRHNGLHFEIQIDPNDPIGQSDPAGVKDVLMEAAVTTIQDCEDSVAAVDAEDKARVYGNWNGIMQGTLAAELVKGGKTLTRRLNSDRTYVAAAGGELPCRDAACCWCAT
ncbi:MAG: hypothetical protein R2911_17365 [Caldilineaceae bacterium]